MSKVEETKVAAEKAEIVKDTKNGVTRPGAETSTGKVWAICEAIAATATDENPLTRSRVIKTAEAEGINVSTAATQYGRYRKYMGLEKETAKAVKPAGEAKAKKSTKVKETAVAAAPLVEDLATEATVDVQPTQGTDSAPASWEAEGEAQA